MRFIEAGKALTYTIRFKVDGEAVSPDADSVVFTLSDNTGAAISGFDGLDVAVASGATLVNVAITNVANVKTLTNELRFIQVDFLYDGAAYSLRDFYQLRDTLNFPLNVDDVRGALNLSSSEVPDQYIDIFSAYDVVQTSITPTLASIISSGSNQVPDAIAAVKYRCALDIVNVIESAMFQSEQADNTLYTRFAKVDFEAMRETISGYYNAVITRLNGNVGSVKPVYAIATSDTDKITGQ